MVKLGTFGYRPDGDVVAWWGLTQTPLALREELIPAPAQLLERRPLSATDHPEGKGSSCR